MLDFNCDGLNRNAVVTAYQYTLTHKLTYEKKLQRIEKELAIVINGLQGGAELSTENLIQGLGNLMVYCDPRMEVEHDNFTQEIKDRVKIDEKLIERIKAEKLKKFQ